MTNHYFIRTPNGITGPHSAREIRAMASDGRLNARDQISGDQTRWVPAESVKGLQFRSPAPAPTAQTPKRNFHRYLITLVVIVIAATSVYVALTESTQRAANLVTEKTPVMPAVERSPQPPRNEVGAIQSNSTQAATPPPVLPQVPAASKSQTPIAPVLPITTVPNPGRIGDVQVSVTDAELRDWVVGNIGNGRMIPGPYLVLSLSIENQTASKLVKYSQWSSSGSTDQPPGFLAKGLATLEDNFGNSYTVEVESDWVFGGAKAGALYPRKPLSERLVFQPPVDGIRYLDLTLFGAAVGQPGKLTLRIPASFIVHK